MKILFITCIVLGSGLISCKSMKEPISQGTETGTEGIASDSEPETSGIVHVLYKGCPVLIYAMIDGKQVRLYPVNLDEAFKVEGVKIKFNYTPSKAQQPESCLLIERVVSVDNVVKL